MGRGYASFFGGLESDVMMYSEGMPHYQRIKIRWCNIGRGYASFFWGNRFLLHRIVARLKTTASGLSRIAIDDINNKIGWNRGSYIQFSRYFL